MGRKACLTALALALCWSAQAASPPSAARKAEAAIMAALSPDTGWQLLSRPRLVAEGPSGYTLRAESPSYRLGNGLAVDFEAIEAQVAPQPGGLLAVTLNLGPLSLRAPEGIWATLTPSKQRITGLWDPARGGFSKLDASLSAVLDLANGAQVSVDQAEGRFTSQAGRLDGTVSVAGLKTGAARTADEVAMTFRHDAGALVLNYRHVLPGGSLPGLAGELLPLRMGVAAKAQPFPAEGVLTALGPWLVEVASRTPLNPQTMWSSLWTHVSRALGTANAQVAVEKLDARSVGLVANGSGNVAFGPAGPRGLIEADLRGINDRIANLTPADRKKTPMLFPSLALMTVVGDGINENGTRFHRYRIELVENGLRVNGREASGLKPQ